MSKYNGWTNYATWRVNLEIFDGFNYQEYWEDAYENGDYDNAYDLGQKLKDYAEELLSYEADTEGLAYSYAIAFMVEVNWPEIAQHMIDKFSVKEHEHA